MSKYLDMKMKSLRQETTGETDTRKNLEIIWNIKLANAYKGPRKREFEAKARAARDYLESWEREVRNNKIKRGGV